VLVLVLVLGALELSDIVLAALMLAVVSLASLVVVASPQPAVKRTSVSVRVARGVYTRRVCRVPRETASQDHSPAA
jgi:hypothetical protein